MKIQKAILAGLVLAFLSTLNSPLSTIFAQGTAFTYQGRLNDGGSPANGSYDLQFTLYGTNMTGSPIAGPVTNSAVGVTNGLFTTTMDFGAGAFDGSARWLEIAVSTNGADAFSTLVPRQLLSPVPYSILANSASNLLGNLPAAQLSGIIQNSSLPMSPTFSGTVMAGSFSGNGANVTNVNAAALDGMNATNFWRLGGNNVAAGQFIGSTNNQPLEFHVNGAQRALRLEPNGSVTPNVIGGSGYNFITPGTYGSVIAGGGGNNGTAYTNSILGAANFSAIGGGGQNAIQGSAPFSTIAGGSYNTIEAGAYNSVISGGVNNTNTGHFGIIPGGQFNVAGPFSLAAGYRAKAINQGAFVWADSQNTDFASSANNQFLVRAAGGVGINTAHPSGALSVNTGAGTLTVRNEYGLTPGIDITNGYFGTLRLRNALEVWPSDDRSQAGRLDVRDTNGNPQISLTGVSGNLSASGEVTAAGFFGNGALPWQVVSGTSVQALPNTAYLLTNKSAQVTITLPPSAEAGDLICIASPNSWRIKQNPNQSILTQPLGFGGWYVRALKDSSGVFITKLWTCVTVSSDGSKMAAAYTNAIYISTDFGMTWTPSAGSLSTNWSAIACSSDGSRLVATVNGGQIYTSSDSGATWTPSSGAPVASWSAVTSSSDGTKLVAANHAGEVYISTDSGASWTLHTTGLSVSDFSFPTSIASSADGTRLVAAGGQVYISANGGVTWSPTSGFGETCACSADGSKVTAVSNQGYILISSDAGVTWTTNETFTDRSNPNQFIAWDGVAESGDGSKIFLIAQSVDTRSGVSFTINPGVVYESYDSGGSWTDAGKSGFFADVAVSSDGTIQTVLTGGVYVRRESTIVGGSGYVSAEGNSSVKLIYVGNGQWMPLSYTGTLTAN